MSLRTNLDRSPIGRPFLFLILSGLLGLIACNDSKPPPTLAVNPAIPLAVRLDNASTRVFSGEEEIPNTISSFEGAPGSVRITLEVEGVSDGSSPKPLSLNDVTFKAVGAGTIVMAIKRPRPGHPHGEVTITCTSGGEESSAVFEPELWFHKSGAIITHDALGGESANRVVEGKEIVLTRYLARNLPQDIRLSLKAMFSKGPVTPRTNAGPKPIR